jgi:hypothetical protein
VATDDVSLLNASSLATFDAVLFFTSGELPVSDSQKSELLQFVRSGRGFAGVHSATDTFYTWPEYGDLIGARFNGHPWLGIYQVNVELPASYTTPSPGDYDAGLLEKLLSAGCKPWAGRAR